MSGQRHTVNTTCKFCRRSFESFGLKKVCPDCDQNMDRYFRMIKEHLAEFPDANVAEICITLDIPSALIKYYLKEERLEIKKNSGNFFLRCEKCGKSISTGRYCFECQVAVTRSEMDIVMIQNPENEKMEREIAVLHSKSRFKRSK